LAATRLRKAAYVSTFGCDTAARGGLRFNVSQRPSVRSWDSRRWPAVGRPPRRPEGLRRTVTGRSIRPGITAHNLGLSANSESATNQACDMGKSALLRGLVAQFVIPVMTTFGRHEHFFLLDGSPKPARSTPHCDPDGQSSCRRALCRSVGCRRREGVERRHRLRR
jgi:hypothetical protein